MRGSLILFVLAFAALGIGRADAYPMPPTPMPKPTPSPSAAPPGDALAYDSMLLFVLDDPISSKSSKNGSIVRAHLKSAIQVAGHTVAPAGTPAQIRIVDVSPADITDIYGFVDIFFEPLRLPDGRMLPLRTPVARLMPGVSSGHQSTVGAEDTVGDIFVPYYPLWQIARKGKNFVLGPGSVLPANTEAALTAQPNGSIVMTTPPPILESTEAPSSTFPVSPLATPLSSPAPTPRAKATPSPTPIPTPAPTPTASPG
ncbi:MAG: hypothetical protein JOZ77_10785 [Candidatus Eremiobacteraeota bacterium]|nr:hypothetical protein [Candidatus Eremiobacteraeota bacterium]